MLRRLESRLQARPRTGRSRVRGRATDLQGLSFAFEGFGALQALQPVRACGVSVWEGLSGTRLPLVHVAQGPGFRVEVYGVEG